MRYPLINNSFLEGFSELVLERGGNPAVLFSKANLTLEDVEGVEKLIPFDRQSLLLDLAAQSLNFPTLGLELASRQTIAIYGPLASMVLACKTMGEALELFMRHIQMRVQTVTLELERSKDVALFTIKSDYEVVARRVRFQDHGLALSYNLIQILCGTKFALRAAYFPHAEVDDPAIYSRYFNCPIAFNHSMLALAFDASILDLPICESAKTIPQRLRSYLEHRHQDDFVEQVKHVITMLLVSEQCNVESVALAMGYSKRTLQRRLKENNTTFQALVDAVRYSQATSYLGHPYYRLTDIAAILGYSELSAFTRSFKRWFGISPQRWRKQQSVTEVPAGASF